MLTVTWDIEIFVEKLTPQIGGDFEKHPLHSMVLRISTKTCLQKLIIPVNSCLDMYFHVLIFRLMIFLVLVQNLRKVTL